VGIDPLSQNPAGVPARGSWDMRADRQTDTLITILRCSSGRGAIRLDIRGAQVKFALGTKCCHVAPPHAHYARTRIYSWSHSQYGLTHRCLHRCNFARRGDYRPGVYHQRTWGISHVVPEDVISVTSLGDEARLLLLLLMQFRYNLYADDEEGLVAGATRR